MDKSMEERIMGKLNVKAQRVTVDGGCLFVWVDMQEYDRLKLLKPCVLEVLDEVGSTIRTGTKELTKETKINGYLRFKFLNNFYVLGVDEKITKKVKG